MFWILSFSETQTTVFGSKNSDEIFIYFLGDYGILKGKIMVSKLEIKNWIIELSNF